MLLYDDVYMVIKINKLTNKCALHELVHIHGGIDEIESPVGETSQANIKGKT